MRFLGPVTRIGDRLVRPHDLVLSVDPLEGARQGIVARVNRIGHEVRLDLDVDGDTVTVRMARGRSEGLRLEPGARLWVRPVEGASTLVAA